MNDKVSAIIFDVDGVLLDSVPYHFSAWKKMFEAHGYKFTYEDYLSKVNGLPRIDGIKGIIPEADEVQIEQLTEEKQRYFIKSVEKNPPQPLNGVLEFLKWLQDNNIPRAAASSSKNAPELLKRANLTQYLNIIVSGNDFSKPKPDPEIFVTAANKLGINPTNAIVIEDATSGILAAKNAGMYTVGLLHAGDTEIETSSDISIHDLGQYDKIVNNYFS